MKIYVKALARSPRCKATLIERNKSEDFPFSSYLNTQQDEELERNLLHDAN
jgi:hypothetical protein